MQENKTRTQTKFRLKSGYKPDSGILSAISSIRQNPKFSRLLGFAMNCLMPHLTLPNPKHRENVHFLISEGVHQNIIRAIIDHVKDDNILFNCTQLVIKIVGRDKFKDEELAKLIIECGAVKALMDALEDPAEKSKHTIKAIIELLNILGVNPSLAQKMIDQGVLEVTTKTLAKLTLTENIVKNGIEALQKIANHPQAKQSLISRNIVKDLVALLEKKSYNPVIVHSGLKFIENICKSQEGVEYLKRDGLGMRVLTNLLEKHPEEKAILNSGAAILGKVATISDLTIALGSLNEGDPKKAHINASIISSLTLVDEMMEEIIRKNAVSDLIAIMKKNINQNILSAEDKKNLIKHCAVAIGRVAEVDDVHVKEIIEKGGLETLNAALDLSEPEVIASCINTLNKISQCESVLPKLMKTGCIQKVLNVSSANLKDQKLCESAINLLENLSSEDETIPEIVKHNGIPLVVRMMKENSNNKRIIEQGVRTLGLLSINEENASVVVENGIVEFLMETVTTHPQWRKCAYFSINLIDGLSEIEQVLPVLIKNGKGVKAVISILSGKSFETKDEESEHVKGADDDEQKEIEVLNPKQEVELKENGLIVLEKLVDIDGIKTYKIQLEKALQQLEKTGDLKSAIEVESHIATLGYLSGIPSLGETILKEDITSQLLNFSNRLAGMKEFEGRSNVISEMVKFFNNLSYMNSKEATRELYQKKKIGQSYIGFVNQILEKSQDPTTVNQGLKSLKAFLNQKTGDMKAAKRGSKRMSLLDVAASKENSQIIENMLDGIVSNIKKYPDNEEIQLNAIEVFNTMCQLSPELTSTIVKMGGSRAIISKLGEELTSKKLGIQCIKLLNNIASSKKDALILLNNQKAGESVMAFLTNQRNDLQCSEAATPVLKLLSNADNSEFTKEIEKDISEILTTIDPEIKKGDFDRQNAAESLEILGNFSLLEKTIEPILKHGAIKSLNHLLSNELKQDEMVLAEKGQLSLNERLIENAISDLNQLIVHPRALKTNIFSQIVQEGIIPNILQALQMKQNSPKIIEKTLLTANNLLNNPSCKSVLVSEFLKKNLTPQLADFLEKYAEEPELLTVANQLLFNLTKVSPQIAVQLSQNHFLKNLIKETKVKLKEAGDDLDSLKSTKQNIQCLTVLASIGETAGKLVEEGGIDFAVAVLKKENQKENVYFEEADYYSLNLSSKEQEKEKTDKAIEQLQPETEEKSIVSNVIDLLEQMVKDEVIAKKHLTPESVQEIFSTIQNNVSNREVSLKALKVLSRAVQIPELAKSIGKNGINTLLLTLNEHPTDAQVVEAVGGILQALGVENVLEQVKQQIPILCSAYKKTNEKSVDELRKANVYLANLLCVPASEDESKVIEGNKNLIIALEKVFPNSLENPEFLASELLLVARLGQQGEETRKYLRESQIAKIILRDIIPNQEMMKPDNGKISELAFEAISQIINDEAEFITMLDSKKGKPVTILTQQQKLENVGFNISSLLLSNNGDLLEEILNYADLKGNQSDKSNSIRTIEKASDFMAKLAANDPSLAAALLNKGGVSKLKNLFEDISKKNAESKSKYSPVRNIGKLISAFSKTPQGFQALLKNSNMIPQIVDSINNLQINQDMIRDPISIETLQAGLRTLTELVDNDYEKAELIEAKVPECVVDVLRKLNQIPTSVILENYELANCVKTALKTLEKMAKDPSLARIIAKSDGKAVMAHALRKAADISRAKKCNRATLDGEVDEIIGSSEIEDRIVENTLAAFVELTNNTKNAEKLNILEEKELVGELKELLKNKADNLVIVTNGLKIIENCLKSYEPCQVKLIEENLKPIQTLSTEMAKVYTKLPLIGKISEKIDGLAQGKKVEEIEAEEKKLELSKITQQLATEASKQKAVEEERKILEQKEAEENKPIELELVSPDVPKIVTVANAGELLSKLDQVVDALDEFIKNSSIPNKVTKVEEQEITHLIATIGEFSGSSTGKLTQLHTMGVTDSLINAFSSPYICNEVKQESITTLSKLTKDDKSLEHMLNNDKLVNSILDSLAQNSKDKLNALQKGIVKAALETVQNLVNNKDGIKKLVIGGCIRIIIEIMKNNKDDGDILISCAEALVPLIINEECVKEVFELKGVELLVELYEKYKGLIELLRAFAKVVARLAISEQTKNKLGEANIHNIIIGSIKSFQNDVVLGKNSCLALANICYGNPKNCEILTKSEIINYCFNYAEKYMLESELMANLCGFYNSLGFKNSPNKKELGIKGVMDQMQRIFEAYRSQRDLKMETLKNCFKAIGNISLFLENSTKIIKAGFVKSASQFIRSNITVADLVKFSLDIFANMASFPEEINDINLNGMVAQGAIETILYCIQENGLNSDVLTSAINALDFFCMNKSIRVLVAEKDGISLVINILKSQDWNKDIVIKCLRILMNLGSAKENLEILLQNRVHQTVVDLLVVQKSEEAIVLQCLRIIAKLAVDKPFCRAIYLTGFIGAVYSNYEESPFNSQNTFELIGILANLARFNEEAAEDICQRGASSILQITTQNSSDAKFSKKTAVLIESLLVVQRNIDLMTQNGVIDTLNALIQKQPKEDEIILASFKSLSSIALANEEYRKLCIEKSCVEYIKREIEIPGTKDLVVSEGKLTISNILATKIEIPPEADFNIKKQQDSKVTKEIKNFLVAGKICKLYKKNGSGKEMHVFLTPDLKEIMAKRPKGQAIKQQWRLPIHQLKETKFDFKEKNVYNQSVFAKSGGLFTKKADPELCISLIGPVSLEGQRVFHMECGNLIEKKKWIEGISAVLDDFKKQAKHKS